MKTFFPLVQIRSFELPKHVDLPALLSQTLKNCPLERVLGPMKCCFVLLSSDTTLCPACWLCLQPAGVTAVCTGFYCAAALVRVQLVTTRPAAASPAGSPVWPPPAQRPLGRQPPAGPLQASPVQWPPAVTTAQITQCVAILCSVPS